MGLSFFLAVGIVYAVQGVKWLMEILPTTKTNNLPSWLWVASALIISALVCYFMKVDALASLGIDVGIYPPWSYLATAFAIAVSSNVIAAVTKPLRKKLRKDGKIICLPPGQEPTTTVTETNAEGTVTTTTSESAEAPVSPIPADPTLIPVEHIVAPTVPENASTGIVEAPVPHWPGARLMKYIPLTGATYYVLLDDGQALEIDKGD